MTPLVATRIAVIVSTVLAALVLAYLAPSPDHPIELMLGGAAGFTVLAAVGQRYRHLTLPILMALLYLLPAIMLVTTGGRGYWLDVIWSLPLLGLICSDRGALQWSVPDRWQWPLVTWSTLVALTWPIVFLREADFAPWILALQRVSNTSIGMSPGDVGLNIAYFALGHNVGLLWIDALCRWYRHGRARFTGEVLAGLLAAAAAASAVTFYQGFVDLGFLQPGFWEYMIRATGTLGDANKMGAVAGFWTIGAMVFARYLDRPWSLLIAGGGLVLGGGAAWLCGSRTGLAAVALSVAMAIVEVLRSGVFTRRQLGIGAGAALVISGSLALILQGASTHTIVQRGTLENYLPFFGDRGIAASANELLWDRFGYGPAAIQMISEHPLAGVGVGMYHALAHDYGKAAGRTVPAPDNAQAWWRHHLAELGTLGIIPLIWWCVVFARELFSAGGGDRLASGMLRGVLIAFFVASMFGVASQSVAITLTFWVFVFWFVTENGSPQTTPSRDWARPALLAAASLVVLHVGLTTVHAFGDLRPRARAERFGWYYRYGYNITDDGLDLEPDPGGNPIGRRWTFKDSLAVIPVKGKALKFVAWIDHPDADVNPVRTQIWADARLVYEGDLRRTPIFLAIPAMPGKAHMTIETSIERTWRPADYGSRDRRELGLSIRDWVWE